MHILPSLHDSFGGSVNVCMKGLLFFCFGFKLLMVQELKGTEVSGDGGKDTGWLEKQKMCTYFNLHDSFGGSVSIFFFERIACLCGFELPMVQELKGN